MPASPADELTWQPSLLDAAPDGTAIDPAFSGLVRHQLDDRSWIDHSPGWIGGAGWLFAEVVDRADWAQRDRVLFGERVTEPRLTSSWPDLPILEEMRRALSERYGVEFVSGGCNLYRDGRDSVAWHRDKIAKDIVDPTVAIVSLGEPRPFLVRPHGGGKSIRFPPGAGDLLVTGGRAQRDWEHTVPKVRSAGPRVSITFRHR